MLDFLADKINSLSKEKNSFKEIFPILNEYSERKIEEKNFVNLTAEDSLKKENLNSSKIKISFIDGGLSEILNSPGLKIVALRICRVDYSFEKNIFLKDFFALINFSNNKYYVDIYKDKKLVLKFSSKEKDIVSLTRRILELKIASQAKTDVVVLDGDLTSKTNLENKIIKESKPILCGFAKTNSIICNNGRSLASELSRRKQDSHSWIYEVSENSSTKLWFLKLHEKGQIFKFEFPQNKNLYFEKTISFLKNNSRNPVFLGYPDSLIEVDKLARISNEETKMFKSLLDFYSNKAKKEVVEESKVKNAHEILDAMSF